MQQTPVQIAIANVQLTGPCFHSRRLPHWNAQSTKELLTQLPMQSSSLIRQTAKLRSAHPPGNGWMAASIEIKTHDAHAREQCCKTITTSNIYKCSNTLWLLWQRNYAYKRMLCWRQKDCNPIRLQFSKFWARNAIFTACLHPFVQQLKWQVSHDGAQVMPLSHPEPMVQVFEWCGVLEGLSVFMEGWQQQWIRDNRRWRWPMVVTVQSGISSSNNPIGAGCRGWMLFFQFHRFQLVHGADPLGNTRQIHATTRAANGSAQQQHPQCDHRHQQPHAAVEYGKHHRHHIQSSTELQPRKNQNLVVDQQVLHVAKGDKTSGARRTDIYCADAQTSAWNAIR